jgi:hypothetical protein
MTDGNAMKIDIPEQVAQDLEVADRIVARAIRGVPDGRHINADEVLPFIRAFYVVREKLAETATHLSNQYQRDLEGMSLHESE